MGIVKDDLQKRVEQFRALELPGQPQMMHTGTFSLVDDLWREVQRLRTASGEDGPMPPLVAGPL